MGQTEVPEDDEDFEVVWDWAHEATERSGAVDEYLRDSLEAQTYNTLEIDHDRKMFKAYFTAEPSEALRERVRDLAGDIPVEFSSESSLTSEEFVTKVDRLIHELGRNKFGLISPNTELTQVSLAVWEAPDQKETAARVTEALRPLEVEVVFTPSSDPEGDYAASRRHDQSLFKGGAAIEKNAGGICSTSFAANRNSDGKRGMITAQHCGYPGTHWWTASGGITYGTGSNSSDLLEQF